MARRRFVRAFVTALLPMPIVPAASHAGELAKVSIAQAFDPVGGVRLIEVTGTDTDQSGGERTLWLMINDAQYARLIGCVERQGDAGPVVQYSDRSRMIMVVVCP